MPSNGNLKVVFDSGVFVSALLAQTRTQLAAELFKRCVEANMLCTAEGILEETRNVLLERGHIRRRYNYSDEQVRRFINSVRDKSTVVTELDFEQIGEMKATRPSKKERKFGIFQNS